MNSFNYQVVGTELVDLAKKNYPEFVAVIAVAIVSIMIIEKLEVILQGLDVAIK